MAQPHSIPPLEPNVSTQSRKRVIPPLSVRRPDLAREWHSTLNHPFTLDQFPGNSTKRMWWQCLIHHHHTWRASIKSRYSKRTGCRRCNLSKRPNHPTRWLSVQSPEISATWHPTRNGALTPGDVSYSSRVRVWWQCSSDPLHVWDTTVNNRQHSGCPFCAGRILRSTGPRRRWRDPISITHPEIAQEWDQTRNGTLSPNQVTAGSIRIVWWQCPIDAVHRWATPVHYRTINGNQCPHCRTQSIEARKHLRADNRTSSTGHFAARSQRQS